MSKLSNQWIDIFAAGDHGEKGNFSQADLDQIVANYNPAHHEAPAVVGHPKTDAPAYGWAESLRRVGDVLQAKFKQVVPAFEEAVESGRFKKRSVSLYNGAKGWSLRHVGFLGAAPPEIKGLADIKFGSEDNESFEIDFEEGSMAGTQDQQEQAFFERMTAWFKKNFGEATKGTLVEAKSFSEADAKAAIDAAVKTLQAQFDAQKAEFAEAQKKLANASTKSRAADAVAKLKTDGRWVPAFEKLGLVQIFDELAKSTEVVTFGEGETAKSATALDLLVEFMEQLPKVVPTATVYAGQAAGSVSTKEYSKPGSRVGVNENSVRLHDAAVAFAESNKVDYATALDTVCRKHPELTIPGSAAVGAV